MRRALVIFVCLIAAACSAADPGLRARAIGFTTGAGVADPYGDGKQHLMAGRYDLAIERFRQALASDRRSVDALNGLAIAHTRLGRFDVAQTYFERALQVDATSALTLNNYGWALIQQGRLRAAEPFLELALQHAAEADVPVVAANIETMGQAMPSALISALERGSPLGAASGQRLVRVAANVHRLEALAGPAGGSERAPVADNARSPNMALRPQPAAAASPEQAQARADPTSGPAVVAEGTGAVGGAPASAEPLRAAGSDLDMLFDPALGAAPINIRPEPEAAAILPGKKT